MTNYSAPDAPTFCTLFATLPGPVRDARFYDRVTLDEAIGLRQELQAAGWSVTFGPDDADTFGFKNLPEYLGEVDYRNS